LKDFRLKRVSLFQFFLISGLVFLNVSRNIDNDLKNYLDLFHFFYENDFLSAFESNQFNFIVKPTEPVFYIITYLLSHILFDNTVLFLGSITLFFYSNLIFGFKVLFRHLKLTPDVHVIYLIVLIFSCINFAETSHLLRQYFAISFLPLFISHLFSSKWINVFLLFCIICLSHNSLLVILIFLIFSKILTESYGKSNYWIYWLLLFVVCYTTISYLLNYVSALSYMDGELRGFYISMYFDLILIFFYFYFSFLFRLSLPYWNKFFVFFSLIFIGFLYQLKFSETLFLRFYLNIEVFRFIYFVVILYSISRLNLFNYLKIPLLIFSFVIFLLRVYVSPWTYFVFDLF